MSDRTAMRRCLAVLLILLPVIAPWLVAEFRQADGAQPVASAKQQGGAA